MPGAQPGPLHTQGYDETAGFIPAVLEDDNQSAIIPAIEALVFPYAMGLTDCVAEDGSYGDYIKTLKSHLRNIMNKETCLYPDGAWKLSSTADNSWMSKICLSQYVARKILGFHYVGEEDADSAHAQWERDPSFMPAQTSSPQAKLGEACIIRGSSPAFSG